MGKKVTVNQAYLTSSMPEGLKGQSKTEIIALLGVPDTILRVGDIESWIYKRKKVRDSYLVDKGSSFGVLMFQGAVAD